MVSYPYDWKGTSPNNAFTEERIITGDNPTDRVVILKNRPFFETSLVVTATGSTTPLTRGVDYEIAYQMPELDDSVASPVANGVILINPDVGGGLTFKGQALGETFYSPFIDILDVLVKHLNNPVDVDWFKVDNRPTFFPAKPAATSWADLLNKKYLASAIHDVELDSGKANDAIRAKLDQLKVTVNGLHSEIVAFNYPGHIKATNPHGTTPAQANAHPASLKTPDTFLAYGKTLRQLTAEIRALGLQQSDIDKYIEKWACKDVSGVFIQQLAANRSLFKSKNGTSEITFTDTAFTLKTNGSVILAAGYDPKDTTTRFMEWVSGTNTLRIESSGNALGMNKLTLNGKVLLTTNLLMKYQPTDAGGQTSDPDDQKIYVQGQNGLSFTGKGSKADPIKGAIKAPTATTAVKGIAKLKSGAGTETSGVAATPDSLTPYEGKANNYVPKTTMLNSKPMDDGARKLTKADLGLGSADNTRDTAKPISSAQKTALDGLSDKVHKHDFDELNMPTATNAAYGLARYTNLEDGLAGSKGVTPNVLKSLSDRLDIIWNAIATVRTGMATDFSAIDASSWSISSGRIFQVKDLQYFYLRDGERGEGKVSGSINLETTPMFNWFSPDNYMERTWAASVKNTAATFDFTGISKKPGLPLKAVPVGLTPNGMGNLSVVSLLTKLRLKSLTGALRLYVAGGGKVSVYVDGVLAGTGNAPFFVEAGVDSSKESCCVGIRVDCNSTSQAAAMMFEIYDEDTPLYRSDAGIPMVQLSEFVPLSAGNRYFMYLNMITGSLFPRAEPVLSSGVDIEYSLIGYVDYPSGGFKISKMDFPKTLDYGASDEVNAHIARKDVHFAAPQSWRLSDNPKMLPIGKLNTEPMFAMYAAMRAGTISSALGLLSYDGPASAQGNYMFLETRDQTPAYWFTPSNPNASGHPTIEGGLVLDSSPSTAAPYEHIVPDLIFATKQFSNEVADYRNRYLRIKLDGSTPAEFGYVDAIAMGASLQVPLPTFTGITSYSTTTITRNQDINPDASVLDMPNAYNQPMRLAVRYRYDIKTRELFIYCLRYPGGAGTDAIPFKEIEFKIAFDVDMRNFMGGFIGFGLKQTATKNERYSMMGSVMELAGVGFDPTKYHYHRALFESYMDANFTYGLRSGRRTTAVRQASGFIRPEVLDTEWLLFPDGEGHMVSSTPGQLPMRFNRQFGEQGPIVATPAERIAISAKPGATSGLKRHWDTIGLKMIPNPSYIPKKIVVTMKQSSYDWQCYYSDLIGGAKASTSSGTITLDVSSAPKRGGVPFYLSFTPPSAAGTPLYLDFTIDFYGQDDAIFQTITADPYFDVVPMGGKMVVKRVNPMHMTERVWNYLQAQMDTERRQDLTDFGEWI